jgi:hypothetical protein
MRSEDDLDAAVPGSLADAGRGLGDERGPAPLGHPDLRHLQRTAGNRAVASLVGASARALVIQRSCIEEDPPPGSEGEGGVVDLGEMPGMVILGSVEGEELAPSERIGEGMGALEGQPQPGAAGSAAGGSTGRPTLRRGSRGPAVVDLQSRLNDQGAAPALEADGIFGRLTKAAVIAFQDEHGLEPDGIVGPLTWGALTAGRPDVPPDVDPLANLPVQVLGHGASEGAVAAARQAAVELFGDLTNPSKARLLTTSVALDVIPHDKQLTDLPEYAHLKGTQTFDGRLWDNVRGIQSDIGGVHRFAIAEEDLVSVPGKPAGYGTGFLAAHEGGHALQASSFTAAQLATLQQLYTARLAASGPITPTTPANAATAMWLNPAWYSAANKEEYFGNSAAAYLGHPYTNGDDDRAMYTRAWLAANDPGMLALLQSVLQH